MNALRKVVICSMLIAAVLCQMKDCPRERLTPTRMLPLPEYSETAGVRFDSNHGDVYGPCQGYFFKGGERYNFTIGDEYVYEWSNGMDTLLHIYEFDPLTRSIGDLVACHRPMMADMNWMEWNGGSSDKWYILVGADASLSKDFSWVACFGSEGCDIQRIQKRCSDDAFTVLENNSKTPAKKAPHKPPTKPMPKPRYPPKNDGYGYSSSDSYSSKSSSSSSSSSSSDSGSSKGNRPKRRRHRRRYGRSSKNSDSSSSSSSDSKSSYSDSSKSSSGSSSSDSKCSKKQRGRGRKGRRGYSSSDSSKSSHSGSSSSYGHSSSGSSKSSYSSSSKGSSSGGKTYRRTPRYGY